ncbi:hypothetical protein HUN58_17345 [Curtobacterium sp. Csp1]|uniref:hypothetical protein n=1 Tax=Curtobacterium sp. Csp1 TaxID=2495429 RepID=UPI00159B3A49|nr:hypothetical protein [Curtobacterium sp. Csp1]QKS21463.1 hypothetical protein HUN58_17345 [Curtobacterium sp. Csp1]
MEPTTRPRWLARSAAPSALREVRDQAVDRVPPLGRPGLGPQLGEFAVATELVFVSDVVGSGTDWETTTGIRDADALRLLRSLQRKIVSVPRVLPGEQTQ